MSDSAGEPGESTRHVVPADLDGERADRVVALVAGLSRAVARRLIEEGKVTVDGRPVPARQRLDSGMQVEVGRPPERRLRAEQIDFAVRYEDGHIAVVDKPSGLVVHPGAGRAGGTLASGLLARWPQVEGVGQRDRWGIVHRLDRDVSGLLVVALSTTAYEALVTAMAARRIDRRYRSVVWGAMEAATGTIDAPLLRDPRSPTRMVIRADGRAARTHYRRLESWSGPDLTSLEVRLETGRTHQIRVHLSSIGHPVVGDRVYGRAGPDGVDPGRIWLHAAHISFDHPVTRETISVASPLPADLRASLAGLGPPDRRRPV